VRANENGEAGGPRAYLHTVLSQFWVGTVRCAVPVAQRRAGATASANIEASFLASPIPPRLRSAGTSQRDVPTFKECDRMHPRPLKGLLAWLLPRYKHLETPL